MKKNVFYIDNPFINNTTILVFDLGGGTTDISIFKIQNDNIKIINNNGDVNLGGRDFDNLIIGYFKEKLKNEYGIQDLGNKTYKLLLECQEIKHRLSIEQEEQLDVEEFDLNKSGVISITRKNFENLANDLLIKISTCIKLALEKAKIHPDQVDKVLQVGGGCRMPMIKKLLKNIFSMAEHCCAKHPDEVVAIGAAYYACYLILTSDSVIGSRLYEEINIPYKVFERRHTL